MHAQTGENAQSIQVRFENMTWKCMLYKLIVSGEQGNIVKLVGTHKKDGAIATLVVQLASSLEGGDLVIYRGEEVKSRHDFGKTDATAASLPYAEYTVEKVTKGYRLALVYSLCLPAVMRHHEKIHDVPLSEDLANAISSMDSEDDSFALVLSHEYIDTRIESVGIGALKGIDSVRFHALEEANTLVPAARKLKFFLVRLTHQADFAEGRLGHWEAERKESSSCGERLGSVNKSTMSFNFLNPAQETLGQLWAPHAVSREEDMKAIKCQRYVSSMPHMRSLRGPPLSMKKTR
ncbi:hypothetical protein GQ600_26038 [Phytophthora cactorum]|nr:hypothetical protein GQ600_26038 [Phytophthora cactorum]